MSMAAMDERDSEFTHDQKISLQRLAALQRMREQAKKGNRASMLATLEKLIDLETHMLRESRQMDDKPA
ncbi:MAG TPA: hypothetical protein VMZ74_08325 [Ramlibacter sp.]|nr:hypothetical protein [Ramlibacter sp.]